MRNNGAKKANKTVKKKFSIPAHPKVRIKDMGNSRYIRKEILGQGAFGVVYSALDKETSKIVAVKCLINKEDIKEFEVELKLLKKMKNSSIIRYFDSFTDRTGALHIVMEYAEGGSLQDVINNYGPLNEFSASVFTVQILKGLEFLHKQNIIHRDIKAANILFRNGEAKLADFGLALDLVSYGRTLRETAGSPYWMAPEVINGDPVNHKCDIWSVGVTIIELMTGKPPFYELPPMPAMFQIAGPKPIPIPEKVTPQCKDFLSLCLNKNSVDRADSTQLLKHPWVQQAMLMKREIKEGSLKIQQFNVKDLETVSKRFSIGDGEGVEPIFSQTTADRICMLINDKKNRLLGFGRFMLHIKTDDNLLSIFKATCGVHKFIDLIATNKTFSLNFLQEVLSYSEQMANSLLIFHVAEELIFAKKNRKGNYLHSHLTGFLLLLTSKETPLYLLYTGLIKKLFEYEFDPAIQVFIPRVILLLFLSDLPQSVIKFHLLRNNIINFILVAVFKLIHNYDSIKESILSDFKKLSVLLNEFSVSEDPLELSKPALSDHFIKIVESLIDDSTQLLYHIATLDPEVQYVMSTKFDPFTFIITKKEYKSKLSSTAYNRLISTLEELTSNFSAKNNLKLKLILNVLLSDINDAEEASVCIIIRIIANIVKQRPDLVEYAVQNDLCPILERFQALVDITVSIRDLVCYIPTTSCFCVWKLKDTNLVNILIDMLIYPIWNKKAINSLSHWAQYDSSSIIDSLILNSESIKNYIENVINSNDYTVRFCETLSDLTRLIKYCKPLGTSIYSYNTLKRLVGLLQRLEPSYQVVLLDFIIQYVMCSLSPDLDTASIIPLLNSYVLSESEIVQRSALRFFVLSKF